MPEIPRFLGIVIAMFYRDHPPPHFHAVYGEYQIEPLKDPAYFQQFRIHPELHTLTWPNGADLAPEFVYEHVKLPA